MCALFSMNICLVLDVYVCACGDESMCVGMCAHSRYCVSVCVCVCVCVCVHETVRIHKCVSGVYVHLWVRVCV